MLAFMLPFGYNLSVIILLWVACFFMFEDLKQSLSNVIKNKWSYVFFGFLVLHGVLSLFSENKAEALSQLERKLSFLTFPVLLFCNDNISNHIKKIMMAFISGCVSALVICLLRAVYLFFFDGINAFFYDGFNYFMHPSYFAMYLTFVLMIIILFGKQWLGHISNYYLKTGLLSALVITGIFLCASKSGILVGALLLPLTLIAVLYNKGYKKGIIGIMIGIAVLIPVSYKLFPTTYNRLQTAFEVTTSSQEINKAETDGTAVRILIWKESVNLIKENFLLGVTPGDENDVLCKAYSKHELTGALEKQLNTHNQYLQTFLGTGIIGFVLLCIMTFGALIAGFMQKNYLLVLFSALAILNFLVESMLQAQCGFMFFVFFLCLLIQRNLSLKS